MHALWTRATRVSGTEHAGSLTLSAIGIQSTLAAPVMHVLDYSTKHKQESFMYTVDILARVEIMAGSSAVCAPSYREEVEDTSDWVIRSH